MQAVAQENTPQPTQTESPVVVVTLEFMAYVALVMLALVLRVANLDSVPLTDVEAQRALASWHAVDMNPVGNEPVADSPLVFWLQSISFTMLGAGESSARILTVLGGILLILSPLLFRARFGKLHTFLLSLILAASSTVFITSRASDPAIWTALFAVLSLWSLWRYWDHRRQSDALLTVALFTVMGFLTGPGGPVLALILLVSGAITTWLTLLDTPDEIEASENELRAALRERLQDISWMMALAVGAGVVVIGSTGFMLYPNGLSMAGALLSESVSGIWQGTVGAPAGFPLLILLSYEPLLLIFAAAGMILRIRQGKSGFVERFLAIWALVAGVVALFYAGGTPGDTLWLVLPLAGLASFVVLELVARYDAMLFWLDDYYIQGTEAVYNRYLAWVKWGLAVIVLLMLIMLSVHLQEMGRSLLTIPLGLPIGEVMGLLAEASYVDLRYSAIWVVITLIFFLVGFFLAASFWGNANSIQGLGMGLFLFMMISGMGGGWNAAVTEADNPAEPWHLTATGSEYFLLRDTLFEIANRETMGFPLTDVTVLVDGDTITSDGLVAWLLRDFENANFVTALPDAQRQEIVILPAEMAEPDLAGAYVGQSFALRYEWDATNLQTADLLAWWLQRRVRPDSIADQSVILWLRQDVYDGVPAFERPQ